MSRTAGFAPDGPKAIGPYSHYVVANGFVFASGQIPLDPKTGEKVTSSVADQTRRALQNLEIVLKAAGSSLALVTKTTVYLTNMGDFAEMNKVYAEFFPTEPPARTAIAVQALPSGFNVEVEAIAALAE